MIDIFFLLGRKLSVVAVGGSTFEEGSAQSQHLGKKGRVQVDVGTETKEHLKDIWAELFSFRARLY